MSFELFFTRFQKMDNLFEYKGNPMEEDAKTHFLFKGVHKSYLHKLIEALKYQMTTNPSATL